MSKTLRVPKQNGEILTLNFPDDATIEEMVQAAKQASGSQDDGIRNSPGVLEKLGEISNQFDRVQRAGEKGVFKGASATAGLPFDFGDIINSFIQKKLQETTGVSTPTIQQQFGQSTTEGIFNAITPEALQQFSPQNLLETGAERLTEFGTMGGGFAAPAISRATPAIAQALARREVASTVGATTGSLAAGDSTGQQVAGAVGGGIVAPGVIRKGAQLGKGAIDLAFPSFTNQSRQVSESVAEGLQDLATVANPRAMKRADELEGIVKGTKFTAAQRQQSEAALDLQRSATQGKGGAAFEAEIAGITNNNRQFSIKHLTDNTPKGSIEDSARIVNETASTVNKNQLALFPANTPQNIVEGGKSARKSFGDARKFWVQTFAKNDSKVDPQKIGSIVPAKLFQAVDEVEKIAGKSFFRPREILPTKAAEIMERFFNKAARNITTREYIDLNSALGSEISSLKKLRDQRPLVRTLSILQKGLRDSLESSIGKSMPKDVAERIKIRSDLYLEKVIRVFDEGKTANILRRGPNSEGFSAEPSAIMNSIFHGGVGAIEDATRFVKAVGGDKKVMGEVNDFILNQMMRATIDVTGKISPKALLKWQRKFEGALGSFKGTKEKIDSISKALNSKTAKDFETDLAVAKAFLGADPDKAIGVLLEGTSPAADIQSVLNAMRGSEAGKRGIANAMMKYAGKSATQKTAVDEVINYKALDEFLDHKAAIEKVLTKEQIKVIKEVRDVAALNEGKETRFTTDVLGKGAGGALSAVRKLTSRIYQRALGRVGTSFIVTERFGVSLAENLLSVRDDQAVAILRDALVNKKTFDRYAAISKIKDKKTFVSKMTELAKDVGVTALKGTIEPSFKDQDKGKDIIQILSGLNLGGQ